MIRNRSAEEIRRFDMMKLGVLLLLIILLFLTWVLTRQSDMPDLLAEAEATAVAKATAEAAVGGLTREPGAVPVPTLAMPAITAPVSYTHLRAHETVLDLVCRLLLEKKNQTKTHALHRI